MNVILTMGVVCVSVVVRCGLGSGAPAAPVRGGDGASTIGGRRTAATSDSLVNWSSRKGLGGSGFRGNRPTRLSSERSWMVSCS
ncbi:hypothetical protein F5050DRAFT_1790876 [Lentinula boryana]|uniref:Secreted protein n=1 Tax=Lentinula boryana TaxID=40481 RepID=A0ABQ8Q0I7_9AGAR|nr:hypothetical protein F5050DRAFT_1790876 [Lentinula boryana]